MNLSFYSIISPFNVPVFPFFQFNAFSIVFLFYFFYFTSSNLHNEQAVDDVLQCNVQVVCGWCCLPLGGALRLGALWMRDHGGRALLLMKENMRIVRCQQTSMPTGQLHLTHTCTHARTHAYRKTDRDAGKKKYSKQLKRNNKYYYNL